MGGRFIRGFEWVRFPLPGQLNIIMNNLELQFNQLLDSYINETQFLSYVAHGIHQYSELVGMGRDIIPFLFKRIDEGWIIFALLAQITQECPFDPTIPKDNWEGKFDEIKDAWLKWGKEKGYTNDI